jgi:hypothetical protein
VIALPAVDERCEFCGREVGVGLNCCPAQWRKNFVNRGLVREDGSFDVNDKGER